MESGKGRGGDEVITINPESEVGDGEEVDLHSYFKTAEDSSLTEPWMIRRRVKALKKILARGMQIERKFYEEISALERQYESMFQPLYAQRLQITSGKYEPNDEECNFPEESDAAYELLHKARAENKGSEGDEADSLKGIPQFWLTAMKNVGVLAEMIENHDEPVLQYLENISVELVPQPNGFKIHFHFAPNEYIKNSVLTKSYTMKNDVDERDPLSYDGPEITNCHGCTVEWKENKNVTQIQRQKKIKDKNGSVKLVTEKFRVPSFFDFFSPPEIPSDPNYEMDEEVLVQLTRDFDIGQFIRETFIPRAVMHYTGEADTDHGSDDEDEGDDETDYDGLSDDMSNMSMNKPQELDPYDP
jgi:nucleosome assembly protein 1-like 1